MKEDHLYFVGGGNWHYFNDSPFSMEDVHKAASQWTEALNGVEKPWLCWNVGSDWCMVQQKLVRAVGWTPVVGFDPRVGAPELLDESVLIDFNAHFKFPGMKPHFPLEFVFLFADRLAFWHSDCLLRMDKMRALADMFSSIPDGEMAAVKPNERRLVRFMPHKRRYWELVGMTTRGASQDQFNKGCGWWMHFDEHISSNESERSRKRKYYWDFGTGIRYWQKKCGGKVHLIPESYVEEGHFTGIGKKDYKRVSPQNQKRNLPLELSLNYDLMSACKKLDLMDLT